MTFRFVAILCGVLFLAHHSLYGQVTYREGNFWNDPSSNNEYVIDYNFDNSIFNRSIQSCEDLYGLTTRYSYMFVSYNRRGRHYSEYQNLVDGIEVDYKHLSPLRALSVSQTELSGAKSLEFANSNGVGSQNYSTLQQTQSNIMRLGVNATDRNYRMGVNMNYSTSLSRGWYLNSALSLRTGRDMYVEGIFTNALSLGMIATKEYANESKLSFTFLAAPSSRAIRSFTTDEPISLLNNNLYNPTWGVQNGKPRSANIRNEFLPLLHGSYERKISPRTTLMATVSGEVGASIRSGLGWYDATTPMPDNYRNLPSYSHNTIDDQAWRENDLRYTQINWDELYAINRLSDNEARYTVENRVTRIQRLQAMLRFSTDLSPQLKLHYGASFTAQNRHIFKRMEDLMDGGKITDMDYFLIDDDTYSNKLQNDLNNPNRKVGEGDMFGYNYALSELSAQANFAIGYQRDKFNIKLSSSVSSASFQRNGYYEKELFAGNGSFGKSQKIVLSPYALQLVAGWAVTANNYFQFGATMSGESPRGEDLLLQPEYNNRIIENPVLRKIYSFEASHAYRSEKVVTQASLYLHSSTDGVRTQRYYDDLSYTFCDMVVSNIGELSYGAELAAKFFISPTFDLSVAATAMQAIYSNDQTINSYSDVDNSYVDQNATAHLHGCKIGGSPSIAFTSTASYFDYKTGWGFGGSVSFVGDRYVDIAPILRSDRIVAATGSAPTQQRLDDCFSVDITASKLFYLGEHRLSIWLLVKNLLNNKEGVYDSYEQSRLMRNSTTAQDYYSPQPSKMMYCYPRSFYLTISYRF